MSATTTPPPIFGGTSGQPFERHRIPLAEVDDSAEQLLAMRPGDAAFFTNYTWHRGEPNESGAHKCAYAVAYRKKE